MGVAEDVLGRLADRELMIIEYRRRTDTNRDLAASHPPRQIAGHMPCAEF
jgi:hypothetical protein